MNYLFLVTESKSANGICCKAIMEKLVAQDNKVFCVTNFEYTNFSKASGVNYIMVKPRMSYRLFAKADIKRGFAKKVIYMCGFIINKLKLFATVTTWPLISVRYCHRIYKLAREICKKEKIDCIIPVYTQIDTLIAANRIKEYYPDIKYIPYFLDSLSGGYGPKIFSREWVIQRGMRWEDRLLYNADKIIMMQSSRTHYEKYAFDKEYYKRIVFLDLPLYNPVKEECDKKLFEKDKINLLYIGTIPTQIRDPRYFFDILYGIKNENILFHIVGSCTEPKLLSDASVRDPRIKLYESVDHEKALLLMHSADIFVNFGNSNVHMTPCKIFEYMSFCKPIISISPIEDEPSSIYLKKYPLSFIVREYEHNLKDDVLNVGNFITKNNKETFACENIFNELESVFYLNTPIAFIEEIEKGV